jgi:hypothetical protein
VTIGAAQSVGCVDVVLDQERRPLQIAIQRRMTFHAGILARLCLEQNGRKQNQEK